MLNVHPGTGQAPDWRAVIRLISLMVWIPYRKASLEIFDFSLTFYFISRYKQGFPADSAGKEPPEGDTRDTSSTPGSGRSPSKGNGNLLQ